jgi:hypothetical protein
VTSVMVTVPVNSVHACSQELPDPFVTPNSKVAYAQFETQLSEIVDEPGVVRSL